MHPLDHMLQASSVAVVGASSRHGSVGELTLRQLLGGGFTGEVYPVNPRYEELHGLKCLPSLEAIGEAVDLVVLAVPNAALESEMEKVVSTGARSVAIFASCHGTASNGQPLTERIRDLAGAIPICGGNGMGFLNIEEGLRVCGFYQPPQLGTGGITFLSHSGSLFSAVLHERRRLGFNLVVSTGLELNTSIADYMKWALDQESTRVVGLFLETVRDPAGFLEALDEANRRDVPVVALKVGSTGRAREAIATHSQAIAGDDAVYEAVFESRRVHRVTTMDEMMDTLELMSAGRRATIPGLGVVHDSGGERALLIDTADRLGVALPFLSQAAKESIASLLDPGLEAENPVDAWGTGRDAADVIVGCLRALADDPAVGVVALSVDLTREEDPEGAYGLAALAAAEQTPKPVVVLCNLAGTVDQEQAAILRRGGIPVLEGTETGLRAIRHLLARSSETRHAPAARLTAPSRIEGWDTESGALRLLERYGIPVPALAQVGSLEEAWEAADEIGYPVVVKTVGVDHKTEHGGVETDIRDREGLSRAYEAMAERLGPDTLVCEQVGPGAEVALGMVTDPQFGPVVMVSAGGSLIEVLVDRVMLLPPVDSTTAREAIDRLAMRPLLEGHRGAPHGDLDALADVFARFSELAVDAANVLDSIDVNPVIVGPDRAVAVDALMKGR